MSGDWDEVSSSVLANEIVSERESDPLSASGTGLFRRDGSSEAGTWDLATGAGTG